MLEKFKYDDPGFKNIVLIQKLKYKKDWISRKIIKDSKEFQLKDFKELFLKF